MAVTAILLAAMTAAAPMPAEADLMSSLRRTAFQVCTKAIASDGAFFDDAKSLATYGLVVDPSNSPIKAHMGWKVVSSPDLEVSYLSGKSSPRKMCTIRKAVASDVSIESYSTAWREMAKSIDEEFDAEKAAKKGYWSSSIRPFSAEDSPAKFGLLMTFNFDKKKQTRKFSVIVSDLGES